MVEVGWVELHYFEDAGVTLPTWPRPTVATDTAAVMAAKVAGGIAWCGGLGGGAAATTVQRLTSLMSAAPLATTKASTTKTVAMPSPSKVKAVFISGVIGNLRWSVANVTK